MIGLRKWLMWVVHNKKIRAPRRKLRNGPLRDPSYRAWIRSEFPCAACGRCYGIEAAHTGPHAIGQKSSDRSCVPLCTGCHRSGQHSLHKLGPERFQEFRGLDIPALVAELNRQWRQRC